MKRLSQDATSPDVLIIGAGPSGATAARILSESGYKVTCLEQGGWVNRADIPSDKLESDFAIHDPWSVNPNVRASDWDYPIDTSESDVHAVNFNGVGGGTVLLGGDWPRFIPSDFRLKTLHGFADDWPITYDPIRGAHDFLELRGVSDATDDFVDAWAADKRATDLIRDALEVRSDYSFVGNIRTTLAEKLAEFGLADTVADAFLPELLTAPSFSSARDDEGDVHVRQAVMFERLTEDDAELLITLDVWIRKWQRSGERHPPLIVTHTAACELFDMADDTDLGRAAMRLLDMLREFPRRPGRTRERVARRHDPRRPQRPRRGRNPGHLAQRHRTARSRIRRQAQPPPRADLHRDRRRQHDTRDPFRTVRRRRPPDSRRQGDHLHVDPSPNAPL